MFFLTFRMDRRTASFGRLVIILIDALRADFVLPMESDLPRMKFVESLINLNETISFKAKANPPTVTLPRIKVNCIILAHRSSPLRSLLWAVTPLDGQIS